jgi:hypothetical protein
MSKCPVTVVPPQVIAHEMCALPWCGNGAGNVTVYVPGGFSTSGKVSVRPSSVVSVALSSAGEPPVHPVTVTVIGSCQYTVGTPEVAVPRDAVEIDAPAGIGVGPCSVTSTPATSAPATWIGPAEPGLRPETPGGLTTRLQSWSTAPPPLELSSRLLSVYEPSAADCARRHGVSAGVGQAWMNAAPTGEPGVFAQTCPEIE